MRENWFLLTFGQSFGSKTGRETPQELTTPMRPTHPFRPALRALLAVILALVACLPGRAVQAGDGSWTQIDAWAGGFQWATNIERGAWIIGSGAGQDDGEWWARGSIMRTWAVGPERAPWKLRAGIAAKAEQIAPWEVGDYSLTSCMPADPGQCGALRFGLRLSADRWAEYGSWGLFLMADYTSIDNAALGVAGLTHLPSRIGAQVSLWHEDGGEATPTIMVSAPVTRRLSVRLGHKFIEDETFLGVSFSTY